MARFVSNLLILAASIALAACGGAGVAPATAQNIQGAAASTAQNADAASLRMMTKLPK
jgi:hypothetical protein